MAFDSQSPAGGEQPHLGDVMQPSIQAVDVGSGGPGPGFAVYVHWPFCAQKCPYCDFNSHVRFGGPDGRSGWDEARFAGAYLAELRCWRQKYSSG